MNNKLIIFDLDGVLVDSKDLHYKALNLALSELDDFFTINENEQVNIYEALPTKLKLQLLTKNKNLDEKFHSEIHSRKQFFTKELFKNISYDADLVYFFKKIKNENINISVASNSIKKTILMCLKQLGIYEFVDYVVSNEDVVNPKPHPEMYWKAMSYFSCIPSETVIFEDSVVGKIAALDSNASLIEIKNRADLNIDKINKAINLLQKINNPVVDQNINVLIPMAGAGSRFTDVGYSFPKPLIDINGKPMIQCIVENLNIKAKYTYVVQKEHFEKYNLYYLLNAITPNCNIVQVNGITEGAAATALLAKSYLDNDHPLIIANSDQILEWNSRSFLFNMYKVNADGGIVIFNSTHPKWSYAKCTEDGLVLEVAEKKVISDIATAGVYYWKKGSDFIKYAEQMINKNIRTNNEFYICPVYNEAIQDNKNIYIEKIKKMWGVGTPEDLEIYIKNNVNYIS